MVKLLTVVLPASVGQLPEKFAIGPMTTSSVLSGTWLVPPALQFQFVVVVQVAVLPTQVQVAAAVYGPTTGPPPPATPAGVMPSVELSLIARARFTRPLPDLPPVVGSALRARRP